MGIDYQLYDGPLARPFTCVCSSTETPMVDTMRTYEVYGRVYLCPKCVRQAALLHDYVPGIEHATLEDRLADARQQIERLEAELEHEKSAEAKVVSVAELKTLMGVS